eukprot:1008868-Pleurochrysis_carterae.AAC.1
MRVARNDVGRHGRVVGKVTPEPRCPHRRRAPELTFAFVEAGTPSGEPTYDTAVRVGLRVARGLVLSGDKIVAQLAAQDLLDPCAFAAALSVVLVVRSEHALHSICVEGAVVFRWVEVFPEAVRPIGIEVRVRRFGLIGAFLSPG